MSYVIFHPGMKGYVRKADGCNFPTQDPSQATVFRTREEASDARPGHHRDMGGNGFYGFIQSYPQAVEAYRQKQNSRWRY